MKVYIVWMLTDEALWFDGVFSDMDFAIGEAERKFIGTFKNYSINGYKVDERTLDDTTLTLTETVWKKMKED